MKEALDTKYGLSIKGQISGGTSTKTKNIDYLNFQRISGTPGTENQNYEKVYTLGNFFLNSIIGGLVNGRVYAVSESQIIEGGE